MKLHLPKALFTAVMALFAVSQTVWGDWGGGYQSYTDGYVYYVNDSTNINAVTDAANYTKLYIQKGDLTAAEIEHLLVKAGDTVVFSANTWTDGAGNLSGLTIGELNIADSGTASVDVRASQVVTIKGITGTISNLSVGGELTIGTAGDKTSTYTISGGSVVAGGKLTLAGGVTTLGLSSGGDEQFNPKGEIIVKSDATLKFAKTDVLSWGKNVVTLDGGTWDVNGTRQSLGAGTILNLIGGTIKDADTPTYGSGHGALDFAGAGSVINSSGNSSITGGIRLRANDVTINVTDGVLSVDTFNRQSNTASGGIIKQGAGTLKITTMATNKSNEAFYTGNTTMKGGTIEYAMDTNGSYNGTISGTGNIAKSGTGTVTLANINGLDGDISVSGGTLNITSLTATKAMDVSVSGGTLNIQSVAFDISELTPSTSAGKYYVYETQGEGDAATTVAVESTTGNGFFVGSSTYMLFHGYEWTGSVDGYETSRENGNTYLTVNNTDITTLYHVTQGTVNMSDVGLRPTDTFTGYEVYSGATLDYAGANPEELTVVLRGGSTLANSGADQGASVKQLNAIRLTGDATVRAGGSMGLVGSSYDRTTLNLAGYKLTKTGADDLLLINSSITAGTIDIQQGWVKMYNQGDGGLSVSDDVQVHIAQGAYLTIQGNKKNATIDGDFLLNATGTGTININNRVNVGNAGGTSSFAGTINIQSDTLRLGQNTGDWNNMVSVSMKDATINMDGGGIYYYGGDSYLGTLNVKQNGTLTIHATRQGDDAAFGALHVAELNIHNEKTLTIDGTWKGDMIITKLTGSGALTVTSANKWVNIDTLEADFGSITNAGTMTLGTADTTVNLSSTITNTGTVNLAGTLALSGVNFADYAVNDAVYDNTGDAVGDANATDGYLVSAGSTSFTVVSGGTISKDNVTSLTYDGNSISTEAMSVADNKLTVTVENAITPTKDYYVNTTVDYSSDSLVASDATEGVVLNGGTLNLNTALNTHASKGIVAATNTESIINIADGVTLHNASVSKDGGTATITGGSTATYNMGVAVMNGESTSANNQTKLNVEIGEGWQGTVVFEQNSSFKYYDFNLNDYGVAGSTIQFNGTATGSYLGSTTATYVADIELVGSGFSIENGFGGRTYTFTGAFKGDGTFNMNKAELDGGLKFIFSGNMNNWQGELKQSAAANNSYSYTFNSKATNIANKVTAAAGTMVVNVENSEAVTMTGDVTATGGTMQLTKTGDSKLTVNNIAANGGNVQLAGTGDNAIEVGNMSIKAGNTVTGTADVTVTTKLAVAAENTLALTGALTMGDNATIDLTGLNINDGQTSYTLATATGGVTGSISVENITGLDLTGTAYEGWSYSIAAVNPNEAAGIATLAEGGNTNTALVLTLTQATQPDTLTTLNVIGVDVENSSNSVLTLTTAENAADAVFGESLNAVMKLAKWKEIKAALADAGITLNEQIAITFVGADDVTFDFDGENNTDIAPKVTINGEGTVGKQVLTHDGTTVGNYVTAYIPEPTTTTLSLLALAALAVRRRR